MLGRVAPVRRVLSVGLALAVVVAVLVTWALRSGAAPLQAASAPTTTARPSATAEPLPEPRQRFAPNPTPTPPPEAKPKPEPAPAPRPSPKVTGFRIEIPSIGLERRIRGMGVSPGGTINPPKGKVIWFQGYGRVRPGAIGTALIAGHVTKGGAPDTFYRLSRVNVGDRVRIVEADGSTKTYRVTRASAIDKTKVTTDAAVWGANTSRSRLAIITCDDAFGYRSDGHRKANLVVIAERV